jgi:mannan endo-1,4-beta-mannosidase
MLNKFKVFLTAVIAIFGITLFLLFGTINVSANNGLSISGNQLLSSNGQPIVMRGTNIAHTFYPNRSLHDIDVNSNLGSNAVRLVLSNGTYAANNWQSRKNDANEVEGLIKECRSHGMVAVLDCQNTTGGDSESYLNDAVNYWIGMKDMLNRYQDCAIINVANEWRGSWGADGYVSPYQNAIHRLRAAGIKNVLMIDAPGWGQDVSTLANNAQAIRSADYTGNTMFSIHMYEYAAANDETVRENIDEVLSKGVCLTISEFGCYHNQKIPYEAIMNYCQQRNVGYLAWSWYGNGGSDAALDLANADDSLKYGWGTDVFYSQNGIKNTSKKINFQ